MAGSEFLKDNFGTVAMLMLTVGGWVFALGYRKAEFSELARTVDQVKMENVELAARQQADRELLIELRSDIKWIRFAVDGLLNQQP